MRLITKATLWLTVLLLVAFTSSFFNIAALRELRKTNELTAQEYEVLLNARRLRSLVFGYHNFGMTAALSNSKEDLAQAQEYAAELRERLSRGLGPDVSEDIQRDFEMLKLQLEDLLKDRPSNGQPFLNPEYREDYSLTLEALDSLVNSSMALVSSQRAANEAFYRSAIYWSWVTAILTVLALLLGLWWFRTQVLKPIQTIFNVVQRLRGGDLSARWTMGDRDEIGYVGRTLNQMSEELDQRRRERVEFVGAVAHDIRNPLTAISNTCQVALKKRDQLEPQAAARMFDLIKEQVDRVARLTEDLLGAAKESRPAWEMHPTRFSLQELAEQVIGVFKNTHAELNLNLSASRQDIQVFADRERINQVLNNLISNGLKFSDPGSPVDVVLGTEGSFAFIEVRDRGVGIPDRDKARIFDPFTRLESGKRRSAGTGLGLAIVKDIVAANSGSISVQDREGGGSVFRVTLPLARG